MTLRRAVSVEDRSHTGVGSGWSGFRVEWEEKHVATEGGKLVKRQFFFFFF